MHGLRRVDHGGITVSDLQRSLAFYEGVLGLERVAEFERDTDEQRRLVGSPVPVRARIVFLQVPGRPETRLELFHVEPSLEPVRDIDSRRAGCVHLCFEVDDLPARYAGLRAQGVEFVSEPVPIGEPGGPRGWLVYLVDPDGVRIELVQWPA